MFLLIERARCSGRTTPLQVAQRIAAAIADHPDLNWFISFREEKVLEQATASTERYASGRPLSLLDGVPFCAKDSMHAQDHVTTCGTAHIAHTVGETDREAPIVASLRKLGGLFLGKTNMHEIGLGVTGLNVIHGTPVNPWNRDCYPGGSSSGGAAVVASGLCPLSVGKARRWRCCFWQVYVRIRRRRIDSDPVELLRRRRSQADTREGSPAARKGPGLHRLLLRTDRRFRRGRDDPVHASRQTRTSRPVASDLRIREAPRGFEVRSLLGGTIGISLASMPTCERQWFNDAAHDVKERCQAMLDVLRDLGGTIVSVSIPELEFLRIAHTTTISSEMRHAMHPYFSNSRVRKKMNLDIQMNLTIAENFRSQEYIQAQVSARHTDLNEM